MLSRGFELWQPMVTGVVCGVMWYGVYLYRVSLGVDSRDVRAQTGRVRIGSRLGDCCSDTALKILKCCDFLWFRGFERL
jgi:hypothetical protein